MSEFHRLIPIVICIADTNISVSIKETTELLDKSGISSFVDNDIVFIKAIDFLKNSNILYQEINGIKQVYALRRLLSPIIRHQTDQHTIPIPANSEVLLEASNFT